MTASSSISAKWDQKRVLVVWFCNPHAIPPPRLSGRQVTVGVPEPGYTTLPHLDAVLSKAGEYDLAEQLAAAGIEKSFDLIAVWSDASRRNCPVNLEAFDCPKLLCLADTHHLKDPLRFMLNYARKVGFDAISSSFNRHHLHWFVEAGFNKCAWIPGLEVVHIPVPLTENREPSVAFLGQAAKLHPRRLRLLEAIKAANIPLRAKQGPRALAAELYSSSVLSFNASLNADLNMRIFEIISAAGCLVTDRLGPYSGLDQLFDEGSEMLCYGGTEELLETIKRALADPKAALEIGKAAHRRFTAQYTQRQQRDVLFNWVFGGELERRYRATSDSRARLVASPESLDKRIELYEAIQEVHRVRERPRILVSSRVASRVCSDAADLPRLQIAQLIGHSGSQQVDDAVPRMSEGQARQQPWDFVLVAPGESAPAGIRAAQIGAVPQALVVCDEPHGKDSARI